MAAFKSVQEMINTGNPEMSAVFAARQAERRIIKRLQIIRASCDIGPEAIAKRLGWTSGRVANMEASIDSELSIEVMLAYLEAVNEQRKAATDGQ